jgi:hypothetical protein
MQLTLKPNNILAIIERQAREIATYAANPPQNFETEALVRHSAELFSWTEALNDMAKSAQAQKSEENGAEAPTN